VPLATPSRRPSALELSESLAEEHEYVRRTIADTIVLTLALVAVCGALAMMLGEWLVGRPVRAIVDKARRVGAGDFGGPLPSATSARRDELGELASEMNAMCDRLAQARGEVESATAARIAVLEQLRHADRLTTVGKLASGVAHELGTPLNVVSGRAAMIRTGEVEGSEALECARVIEQSAYKAIEERARARDSESAAEEYLASGARAGRGRGRGAATGGDQSRGERDSGRARGRSRGRRDRAHARDAARRRRRRTAARRGGDPRAR
jgi:signal transduction histidine kinase